MAAVICALYNCTWSCGRPQSIKSFIIYPLLPLFKSSFTCLVKSPLTWQLNERLTVCCVSDLFSILLHLPVMYFQPTFTIHLMCEFLRKHGRRIMSLLPVRPQGVRNTPPIHSPPPAASVPLCLLTLCYPQRREFRHGLRSVSVSAQNTD